MSHWKKILTFFLSAATVASLLATPALAAPITSSPTTGPCKGLIGSTLSRCQAAQASSTTVQKFNPNVNVGSGNSYSGASISGVGGAIASCTNVGSFLTNTASSLLSATVFGKAAKPASSFNGNGDAVKVSDEVAQKKLASIDKTSQCLDGIAYAVAKNTLAQVTNKTLNWVNTGLNGNPLYVQNVDSYLKTVANQQIRAYLQTAQGSDPIFGNALKSTIFRSITGQSDGLLNVSPNTPEAHAYNSFLGDFTSGGWSSLLNPANNPIGALFTANDNLAGKISSSTESSKAEIQRNNGFLDMKHCVETAPVDTSTTAKAISNGLSQNPTCLQWVTDTPGSIIASQVQTITNSPVRQLEYANKINEVLGGFFDSFVNSLLSKGLRGSGMNGGIDFGFSSQGDNIILDSSGNALNLNGANLGYQSTTGGNALDQSFDISRPQQFRAVLQAQVNYVNRAKDAQIALNRVVPTVGALDYCIPGPNPTWAGNSASNLNNFVSSLQQADPKNPSLVQKILGALPVIGGLLSLFSSSAPPQVWSTDGLLGDPATGLTVQVPRVFQNKGTDFSGGTGQLVKGLTGAYNVIATQYHFYDNNTEVAKAFTDAAKNDTDGSYVGVFLREEYNETSSLLSYNQASSQIDTQYDNNIGQTESSIDQMKIIQKQVNAIVATAKADYIKKRAAAGNPVDMACINSAYQIDSSPIVGVARQESDKPDAIVQHSADSASYFYNDVIN
ncbi:MAG: hypothetical protein JWL92_98 [Candidatus Nomurabacteria bacterium]|nr:hypothetical protein [Candidatus Nomurabacteria bacterium]